MFTVSVGNIIDIPPETSKPKSIRSNCAQTEILSKNDNETQMPEKKNSEVQTNINERKENIFVEFDVENLSNFLNKIYPYLSSVLERNIKSHAFDRYKFLSEADDNLILNLYTLEKLSFYLEFCCTSLSWNYTGTSLAVGYGNKTHESWCEHDSSVCIWSLNCKDFDVHKPQTIIETDCCITYIAFHPKFPALLIGGKFNGEIVLWDISKDDDPLMATSHSTDVNHREPITGLHWIVDQSLTKKIEFVSCSLDGKILLWKFENELLKPYDGFIILTDQMPKNLSIKTTKENSEIGITAISFNVEDPSIFIIGIEGGGLFQCSLNSMIPSSYIIPSSITYKNPITMNYEKHKGQVTSVDFSPFTRNIFLTAGSEGEIHIYSLLEPKPLMIFHVSSGGIVMAHWSPVRPLLFSSLSTNGELSIWDLQNDENFPITNIYLTEEKKQGTFLKFNKENSNLLATASIDGKVQIWQFSGRVTEPGLNELKQLQELEKNVD